MPSPQGDKECRKILLSHGGPTRRSSRCQIRATHWPAGAWVCCPVTLSSRVCSWRLPQPGANPPQPPWIAILMGICPNPEPCQGTESPLYPTLFVQWLFSTQHVGACPLQVQQLGLGLPLVHCQQCSLGRWLPFPGIPGPLALGPDSGP